MFERFLFLWHKNWLSIHPDILHSKNNFSSDQFFEHMFVTGKTRNISFFSFDKAVVLH